MMVVMEHEGKHLDIYARDEQMAEYGRKLDKLFDEIREAGYTLCTGSTMTQARGEYRWWVQLSKGYEWVSVVVNEKEDE